MKIGIITIHNSYNYGAVLQAFATQEALSRIGHEGHFINLYSKEQERNDNIRLTKLTFKNIIVFLYLSVNPKYKSRIKRFRDFKKKILVTRRYFSKEELYNSVPEFDVYLAGSDQIWNMEYELSEINFLDFVDGRKYKKISYASSFGTKDIPVKYEKQVAGLLEDFSAISVREDDGVKIIKRICNKNASHVLDPTLLLSKYDWEKYIQKDYKIGYDYILIYALNNTEESVQLLEAVRKRYKLKVVGIPMGIKVPSKFNVDKLVMDAGPLEFVSLFKNAKIVCTSSFHGLAFSVNFEKTFYIVPHLTRNSRIDSLLKLLDLSKRQQFSPEEVLNLNDNELYLNYLNVNNTLSGERKSSSEFLAENLS